MNSQASESSRITFIERLATFLNRFGDNRQSSVSAGFLNSVPGRKRRCPEDARRNDREASSEDVSDIRGIAFCTPLDSKSVNSISTRPNRFNTKLACQSR